MRLKRKAARLLERWTGWHVLERLPAGHDLAADVARYLPDLTIRTVIDVGANEGQSARRFARDFPHARIHSFEPGEGIHEKLLAAVADLPAVRCHRLALGRAPGRRRFVLKNLISHLVAEGEDLSGKTVTTVDVDTLERVCAREGIERVGLLKIDAEGADLEVLDGAWSLLAREAVDLVEVEAGISPRNDRHVPLDGFRAFLEPYGYLPFGLYEQTHEFSGEPQLRRVNAAFVSPALVRTVRVPRAARAA